MRKRASGRERPQQGALTCLPAPTPQFLLGDGRYDPFSPAPLVHSCCLGWPPSFSTVFVLAWYSGAASSSLPMREAGVDHERHSARQDCELWFTDSHLVVGCASHSCLAVSFNSYYSVSIHTRVAKECRGQTMDRWSQQKRPKGRASGVSV